MPAPLILTLIRVLVVLLTPPGFGTVYQELVAVPVFDRFFRRRHLRFVGFEVTGYRFFIEDVAGAGVRLTVAAADHRHLMPARLSVLGEWVGLLTHFALSFRFQIWNRQHPGQ